MVSIHVKKHHSGKLKVVFKVSSSLNFGNESSLFLSSVLPSVFFSVRVLVRMVLTARYTDYSRFPWKASGEHNYIYLWVMYRLCDVVVVVALVDGWQHTGDGHVEHLIYQDLQVTPDQLKSQ